MTNCKHCDHIITEKYCPNCGQPAKLKRIDGHYIKHEIEHLLHLEKGIFYTIKELLIRPGESIREFIHDNRNRLVKPVVFVIIMALIYTIIVHFFHMKMTFFGVEDVKATTTIAIDNWLSINAGYAMIFLGIFIVPWIKLFFKNYGYNFYEILILMCFVLGIWLLIKTFFAVINELIKLDLNRFSSLMGLIYSCWAIAQFFDKTKPLNYIKPLLAFILGATIFSYSIKLVGFLVDLAVKY